MCVHQYTLARLSKKEIPVKPQNLNSLLRKTNLCECTFRLVQRQGSTNVRFVKRTIIESSFRWTLICLEFHQTSFLTNIYDRRFLSRG